MSRVFSPDMAAITRLVQSGRLTEATAQIQAGLSRNGGAQGGGTMGPEAARTAAAPTPLAAPQGTRPTAGGWTTRRHVAAGIARDLQLYRPAAQAGGQPPAGQLLLLHGCTQTPEDFARGTWIAAAAERHNLLVVAPAQPQAANMNRCWNWFEPQHVGTDGGEAAFLADLSRSIAHDFEVPPDLRFAAGLSAGGAMAVTLGAVFAQDFGAVACHSGLPHGAARSMAQAFAAMGQGGGDGAPGVGCRLFLLHGSADTTVSPRNADAILTQTLRRQPGLARSAADARLAGHDVRIARYRGADGALQVEDWRVDGLRHAWSGGAPEGSHTAPGPSATDAMLRFFLG